MEHSLHISPVLLDMSPLLQINQSEWFGTSGFHSLFHLPDVIPRFPLIHTSYFLGSLTPYMFNKDSVPENGSFFMFYHQFVYPYNLPILKFQFYPLHVIPQRISLLCIICMSYFPETFMIYRIIVLKMVYPSPRHLKGFSDSSQ